MDIILIAGGSASGKTTFASALRDYLPDAGLLSQDSFYHCQSTRVPVEGPDLDFDIPDAIDWSRLEATLTRLRAGLPARMPVYNFATSTRIGETDVSAEARTMIVEGTLVLTRPECRRLAVLTVFIDADESLRRLRRESRDVEARDIPLATVRDRLSRQVFPAHSRFIEPSARHADLVLDARKLEEDIHEAVELVAGLYESRRDTLSASGRIARSI